MSTKKERKVIAEAFADGHVDHDEMEAIAKVTRTPYEHKAVHIDSSNSWVLVSPDGHQYVTSDLAKFSSKHRVDDKWKVTAQ